MDIRHTFVSAKSDGVDDEVVRPSDWNAGHSLTGMGTLPYALPLGYSHASVNSSSGQNITAGSVWMEPVHLAAPMLLQSLTIRDLDTSGARAWEWKLYRDGGDSTIDAITGADGSESFTASAASYRTAAASGAPVTLTMGVYWLLVRNSHATQTFSFGGASTGQTATAPLYSKTKTATTLSSSLEVVSGWTTTSTALVYARLNGRVFGESIAWA